MIKEIAGGEITGEIVDVYPAPKEKIKSGTQNHYLKKLSGKIIILILSKHIGKSRF